MPYRIRGEEDILVGEDDIILSVVLIEENQMIKIVSDQSNRLVQGGNNHNGPFRFWLFENGFHATYAGDEGPLVVVGPSNGEKWEFVA